MKHNRNPGKIMMLLPMVKPEILETERRLFGNVEDVEVVAIEHGPGVISSRMDQALAGSDSVKKAKEAEAAGYKAIVVTCHGDPNLYALREAVRIPVLGPMHVAMHLCSLLASRFSIIVTEEVYTKHSKEDLIVRYGFEQEVASIRRVPFKRSLEEVVEASSRRPIPEEIIGPALAECIKAVEEDGAEAITFGCGAFTGMVEELERRLKDARFEVPLINPLPLAVELAKLLIRNKLSHSVLSYPLAM